MTEGGLHLFDTSDTEVEADTFDELIKSGVRDFKIGYRHCPGKTGKVILGFVSSLTNQSIVNIFSSTDSYVNFFVFKYCYYFG